MSEEQRQAQAAGPEAEGANEEPAGDTAPADEQQAQRPTKYPSALYTQQEVVDSQEAFAESLAAIHEHMGCNPDKIPKMAGKDLDLHLMYKSVTGFGGFKYVTRKKMWKDVGEAYNLPPTITSSSYTLKRVYRNCLWDMEQVYFNGQADLPVIPPPDKERVEEYTQKKRKSQPDNVMMTFPGVAPGTPTAFTGFASGSNEGVRSELVGSRGSCTVDARFDCGYFCTIKFGKQEFKGVLYHPPPECTIQPTPTDTPNTTRKRKANEDAAAVVLASLPQSDLPKSSKKVMPDEKLLFCYALQSRVHETWVLLRPSWHAALSLASCTPLVNG